MIRKVLEFLLGLPLAIGLFVTFAGAVIAVVGAIGGFEDVKTTGGALLGLGALGSFVYLASPFGQMIGCLPTTTSNTPAQSRSAAAGKKEAG